MPDFWLILTFVALTALLIVHLHWRRRFRQAEQRSRFDIQALEGRLQQEAERFETQQEALFNSMVEGVLLLDAKGHIQLANRAFLTLFDTISDVRGRTVLEVVRQHELTDVLQRVANEGQVLDYELQQDGPPERWLQINAAALSTDRGAYQGAILVFHDLTRLKHLERTRQEFVANVSHELRTPLSLIKGYVETLLDGAKDDPAVQTKFLETIQRNAERLRFLIEDLLTISELESGNMRMNLQPVELRRLAEKILDDFKTRAAARRVTLTNAVPELFAPVDADRLQQVFANLVDNAIKYGRNDGHVTISAHRNNGTIELCIQDDGPGIPSESLERIFERFYRVDKARSREQGGTGLGLSIVKHIVQGHGGRVWARSEPGKGAAFYFTLPAAEPM